MDKVVVFISDIELIISVLKLHTFQVKVKFFVSRFAFLCFQALTPQRLNASRHAEYRSEAEIPPWRD